MVELISDWSGAPVWSDDSSNYPCLEPGRVAQSVGHLTRYPVWPHTFVSPSADSRGAVVSYWRKYVHEILVNFLGGLSLPRKSVVRLTDRPDITLDVYRGRKTTTQQPPPLSQTYFHGSKDVRAIGVLLFNASYLKCPNFQNFKGWATTEILPAVTFS